MSGLDLEALDSTYEKNMAVVDNAQSQVVLVETPCLDRLRSHSETDKIATIQVRSHDGSKTFVAKMTYEQSIRDLVRFVSDAARMPNFELLSNHPRRVGRYCNDESFDPFRFIAIWKKRYKMLV